MSDTKTSKINYDFIIQTVDGRPMQEQSIVEGAAVFKDLHAADSLASFLSARTEGEKMQFMEWARELFKNKSIVLSEAQTKIIKSLIEKDKMTAVLEEAYVQPLDKALLKMKPN